MVVHAADTNSDQKKKSDHEIITEAINRIAQTKDGRVFFRWMAVRCFKDRSTIVGNPDTHEINPMGSVAQAYVQRLYQDIYRAIKPEIRIKIDYPNQTEE